MKLKIQSETGIIRNTQKLKTCTRKIYKGKDTYTQKIKPSTELEAYLSPKEQKKWERLSPKRKAYFKNRGDRLKKCTGLLQGNFGGPPDIPGIQDAFLGEHDREPISAKSHTQDPASRTYDRKQKETGSSGHPQTGKGTSEKMKNTGEGVKQTAEVAQKVPSGTKTAIKAAKRSADFFKENLTREEQSHEQMMEETKKAYQKDSDRETERLSRFTGFLIVQHLGTMFVKFITSGLLYLFLLLSVLASFLVPLLVIIAVLAGIFGSSGGSSLTALQDPACYLSAKYESHGDCGSIGSGGMGEYGFDKSYSLASFVSYCYNKDSGTYACFEPYLGRSGASLYEDADFRKVWKQLAQDQKAAFEADQTVYTYDHYFLPAATLYTQKYGYDFVNAPDAVKACVTSFSIRDGAASAASYFSGVTADTTPEEVIRLAYGRMKERRPVASVSGPRWQDEEQDCLALLDGTLDIYEPDTSPSGYGGIDWSWKKGSRTSGNGDIAALALSKVGCRYSQQERDGEGVYDCSSLVYRLYAQIGITYLSGMCAAEEAQYLESHQMGVTREELMPGDLIFYSYENNGRYKNISHVAIYIGDGKQVHAANKKRGVVCDPLRESNIGVYARPR